MIYFIFNGKPPRFGSALKDLPFDKRTTLFRENINFNSGRNTVQVFGCCIFGVLIRKYKFYLLI